MNLSFNKVHFHHRRLLAYKTHTILLWYIYLHEWLIFRVHLSGMSIGPLYICHTWMLLGKSDQPEAHNCVPQVYPTSNHMLKHPKREGASPENSNCRGPRLFRVTKKNARHVVSTHGKASHHIRPPDGWKLLKSLQGNRCIRKYPNMELVILWAPWAIGKCWWVSTTWLRITAILSCFFLEWPRFGWHWEHDDLLFSAGVGSYKWTMSQRIMRWKVPTSRSDRMQELLYVKYTVLYIKSFFDTYYSVLPWVFQGYSTVYDPLPFCHRWFWKDLLPPIKSTQLNTTYAKKLVEYFQNL